MGLLALHSVWPLPDLTDQILRVAVMTAVLWFVVFRRDPPIVDFKVRHVAATLAIGILVFVVWIAPDVLFKGYRHFWLFENALTGKAETSMASAGMLNWPVLAQQQFLRRCCTTLATCCTGSTRTSRIAASMECTKR